jgi:putative flippase GtrA
MVMIQSRAAQATAVVRSDEFARVFRYGTVSAINVVGHQSILFLANSPSVGGMSGGPANALAATIMCVPAYLLSRNWVWQVDGAHSVKFQVLPFWVITIIGLLVSTAMAAAAQAAFGAGLAVNIGAFAGYFLVWIAKFLVLQRLFGRFTAS